MYGINKVMLAGHLGKAPDLRFLDDGVAVTSFPFATSEIINKDGGKLELTEWHNIVLWRGLAESAHQLLKKGSLVYIEGKMRTRNYLDREGRKKYTTEIVAELFTLLSDDSGDFG